MFVQMMNTYHLQKSVLNRYRSQLPTMQRLAAITGVPISTVAMFLNGNSNNAKLRETIANAIGHHRQDTDVDELLGAWKENAP